MFAGIVVAGIGVIVLALDLTRKSTRPKAAAARDAKPSAPVELIKPGDYVRTGEPGKPSEPVRPLTPVRPLDGPPPVAPAAPAAPAEPAKPASMPAPVGGGSLADRLVP